MSNIKTITITRAGVPVKIGTGVSLPTTSNIATEPSETYAYYQPVDTSRLLTVNDWQYGSITNYAKLDRDYDSHLRSSIGVTLESDIYDLTREYEKKYNLSSSEFYKQWLGGTIEDSEDFYNWASLYSLLR